jgi:hypothetical protein
MKNLKEFIKPFWFLILFVTLVTNLSSASSRFMLNNLDDGKQVNIEDKIKKYEGTFQIQVKDIRCKPSIPYNIDELIEKNRKQTETVYINLGSAVRLKILSLDEIKKNNNKKIDLISAY